MRINSDNKSMDIEARDINYILPAYLRSYQFYSQNALPTKIIFPMFVSVKVGGVDIPIEWVPPLDPIATEIAEDGKNVAEVTEEQIVALDKKDEEIARLKAELAQTGRGGEERGGEQQTEEDGGSTQATGEKVTSEQLLDEAADLKLEEDTGGTPDVSPAKTAFATEPAKPTIPPTATPDRQPKQPPGGDIGRGQGLSDMHPRDQRDQARTASDLKVEPSIEGAPEKPFEKEVKRDEKGNPIVEDKSDAPSGQ